jgi:hypothetical protein
MEKIVLFDHGNFILADSDHFVGKFVTDKNNAVLTAPLNRSNRVLKLVKLLPFLSVEVDTRINATFDINNIGFSLNDDEGEFSMYAFNYKKNNTIKVKVWAEVVSQPIVIEDQLVETKNTYESLKIFTYIGEDGFILTTADPVGKRIVFSCSKDGHILSSNQTDLKKFYMISQLWPELRLKIVVANGKTTINHSPFVKLEENSILEYSRHFQNKLNCQVMGELLPIKDK